MTPDPQLGRKIEQAAAWVRRHGSELDKKSLPPKPRLERVFSEFDSLMRGELTLPSGAVMWIPDLIKQVYGTQREERPDGATGFGFCVNRQDGCGATQPSFFQV